MKFLIKILLFFIVASIANLKVVSAVITLVDIPETTISSSFHTEIPKTIFKVIENDLINCCQKEKDLVDYRNWGVKPSITIGIKKHLKN